jgi:hypothetical protein
MTTPVGPCEAPRPIWPVVVEQHLIDDRLCTEHRADTSGNVFCELLIIGDAPPGLRVRTHCTKR